VCKNQPERDGIDRAGKANAKAATLDFQGSGCPVLARTAPPGSGLKFAEVHGPIQSQRHEHLARRAGLDRRAAPSLQQPAANSAQTRQRRNVNAGLQTFSKRLPIDMVDALEWRA
jgi:hypothetical protein